jgi:PAS domain S-box-containing protein
VSSIRDVSDPRGAEVERERLLAQAEAAEARFRALVESAPDGIVTVDRQGRIVLVNTQAEKLFGYSRDELLGQPIELLVPERFHQQHVRDRERFTAAPRTRPMGAGLALTARRKDGSELPVEISLSPLQVNGELLITSIIRDVTERQRAEAERAQLLVREQAARAEAERLARERAAILGQIADAVLIADPTGRITFINDAARRLHGLAPGVDSVTGVASGYELLTADGRPYPLAERPLARAALRGETVLDAELRIRRADGSEVLALGSATPVVADDGTRLGAVLTLHDVTARRALERQKDEFLANVSHDLRTPLAGIKASIGVVLANEPAGMPEPLHRMLANIDLAADRMGTLVSDLLELARFQAGRVGLQRRATDLRALAERVAAAIEPLAQSRGQRVAVVLPTAPLTASVDAHQLERALLNLLGNAQKYGRDGGRIGLCLEPGDAEVRFLVTDDGPGIPLADQPFVFERFYRSEIEATQRSPGSGLGLPIARAIVELHGGRIWVESMPGQGATFHVALPLPPAKDGEP